MVNPSPRARRVAEKMLGKQGSAKKGSKKGLSLGQAMVEAGYSPKYARNAGDFQETKGWQVLLEEYLPDEYLGQAHLEVINKKEILIRNNNETGEIDQINTGQPHSDVKSGLDMAYKLKGKYARTIVQVEPGPTYEELEAELDKLTGKRWKPKKNASSNNKKIEPPSSPKQQNPRLPQPVSSKKAPPNTSDSGVTIHKSKV